MFNKTLIFSVVAAVCILPGCAHHRDVRTTASGIHEVSFVTERKQEGYRQAFKQAKDFCVGYEQSPAIVSESSEYVGRMNEEDYNRAKTVTEVVSTVGVAGMIFGGGKNDSDVGTVAAVGGGIADQALGEGYRYTMQFRCQ